MLESRVESDQEVSWDLPYNLTILPTYRCSAACKQCCFQSNPTIQHRIPQDRLLNYIEQAAELGTVRLICFSGGEPFLLGHDLVELVQHSSEKGFISRIVSNGFWALTLPQARRRLEPLVEVGLNELNFSTGDDHAAFVPINAVLNGMEAAMEVGLRIALMVENGANRLVTREVILQAAKSRQALFDALIAGTIPLLESPWMQFTDEPVDPLESRLVNRSNVHLREPCKSVLTTIVVTPGEQLGMCCGLPRETIPDLHAGSLRDGTMKQLFEQSSADFLKIWLFVEGPEKMLAWAASKDPTIQWENKYAHNCDACRAFYSDEKVMRVVEEHYGEKYEEIMLKYALSSRR